MVVGVPREIKVQEHRVGLTPAAVRELSGHGHKVLVQAGAGLGIGATDQDYLAAGAELAATARQVFDHAELVVKVKEPQAEERAMLRPGQVLFTYLHLASDPVQTRDLMESGATCIAYETVTDARGTLPLLAPMSEIAGRMSLQAGARALEKVNGGRGLLLGGVPGVAPARVTILGGGVVGSNAARMACGLRADVTVLDKNVGVLRALDVEFQGRVKLLWASASAVEAAVRDADLVVGAVLVPGAAAPKLVDLALLRSMRQGSALVDVAIDQGGCFVSSRPTTHAQPMYVEEGVVHYCVANMPGAVASTSTHALVNATLPYVSALADRGWKAALGGDRGFLQGLNVSGGKLCCARVAEAQGLDAVEPERLV